MPRTIPTAKDCPNAPQRICNPAILRHSARARWFVNTLLVVCATGLMAWVALMLLTKDVVIAGTLIALALTFGLARAAITLVM